MTDKALIDEVMTLIVTGHETTASTFNWACYALSQHPVVEARLLAEVDGMHWTRRRTSMNYRVSPTPSKSSMRPCGCIHLCSFLLERRSLMIGPGLSMYRLWRTCSSRLILCIVILSSGATPIGSSRIASPRERAWGDTSSPISRSPWVSVAV